MACLESLPVELKTIIFHKLAIADKHSVVRTCRSLCVAALPCLYYAIDANGGDIGLVCERKDVGRANIIALCRTLIERPDLAKHVRILETHNCSIGMSVAIPSAELILFREAVNQLSTTASQRQECKQSLAPKHGTGTTLPVLVLILSRCGRLANLSISSLQYEFFRLREFMTADSSIFRRLSSLHVIRDHHDFGSMISAFQHFLPLPGLAALQIICRQPTASISHDTDLWRIASTTSATTSPRQLTGLSVSGYQRPMPNLSPILQQTRSLQMLKLNFLYLGDRGYPVSLSDLSVSLNHLRTTLVHLTVRADVLDDGDVNDPYRPETVQGDLTFLKHFTTLETLETSLGLLVGQSVNIADNPPELTMFDLTATLPSCLRTLKITDDECPPEWLRAWKPRNTLETLTRFLCSENEVKNYLPRDYASCSLKGRGGGPWRTITPELRELHLEMRRYSRQLPSDYSPDCTQEAVQNLQRMCEDRDIACCITFSDK